jgi:hypothetical protein
MEKYTSPDGAFALYKPPGWTVEAKESEGGRTVTVCGPGGGSYAVMKTTKIKDPKERATVLASRMVKELAGSAPDLKLLWAKSTEDRRRTVMEIRYTNPRNVPVRRRCYINLRYPDATVFGYEAPEKEIDALRPTLLSVISNFTLLDPSAAAKASGASAKAPKKVEIPPMSQRTAKDGSFHILVPQGWRLEGGKGQALVSTPGDGVAGFASLSSTFWGPSQIGFDASRIPGAVRSPYLHPAEALILAMRSTGSRNHRIVERKAENEKARQYAAALRTNVEVETVSIVYDSKTGVQCQGFFEVMASRPLPSGQWGILLFGIWAPQKELPAYMPTMTQVADSYRIDQRFAREYIRQGNENLSRLIKRTADTIARTNREISEMQASSARERQRSQDYIDYKRTGVIRGEQEWVSEVEGGALYKSDAWGLSREGERKIEGQDYNYYNYKGQNPRYKEDMTPVDSSREVYESVYGK